MALPVAATPVLDAEDAKAFFAKVDSDLRKPVGRVPTPKLKSVDDLIEKYVGQRRQKQSL